jgi:hypothetical protein
MSDLLLDYCHRLQDMGWATALRESQLMFPFIEGLHLIGLAFIIGPVLMLDFRFASEGGKLYENAAFGPKMWFLLAALVCHYTLHKKAVASEHPRAWGPSPALCPSSCGFSPGPQAARLGSYRSFRLD